METVRLKGQTQKYMRTLGAQLDSESPPGKKLRTAKQHYSHKVHFVGCMNLDRVASQSGYKACAPATVGLRYDWIIIPLVSHSLISQ